MTHTYPTIIHSSPIILTLPEGYPILSLTLFAQRAPICPYIVSEPIAPLPGLMLSLYIFVGECKQTPPPR